MLTPAHAFVVLIKSVIQFGVSGTHPLNIEIQGKTHFIPELVVQKRALQSGPVSSQKRPRLISKEPYILSKESYTQLKEPCNRAPCSLKKGSLFHQNMSRF